MFIKGAILEYHERKLNGKIPNIVHFANNRIPVGHLKY